MGLKKLAERGFLRALEGEGGEHRKGEVVAGEDLRGTSGKGSPTRVAPCAACGCGGGCGIGGMIA